MLAVLCMLALAPAAPASSPAAFSVEPTADGIRLVATQNGVAVEIAELKTGPVVDLLRHGDMLYLALASGGVAIVSLKSPTSPALIGTLAEGRLAQRLGTQGSAALVVFFADRSAAAFSLTDPLAQLVASSSVAPTLGPRGKVIAVHAGRVTIDAGSSGGFREGEHVAILPERAGIGAAAVAAGAGSGAMPGVVITLDQVEADRSVGSLGRGDSAAIGDTVELTPAEESGAIFFPRATAFAWRNVFTLRPFVSTSGNGVGALLDETIGYYFSAVPLRVEAGLQPLGFAFGAEANHNPLIAFADVAYSAPFFELGLGGGVSALASASTGGGPSCELATSLCLTAHLPATQSPLVVETLRLGALDGWNLTWIAAVGTLPGQGFQLLSARAETNLPITRWLTLFAGGGGGPGYFYGEGGLRGYVNGVGGPGTVILSAGLGWAGIQDDAPEVLSGPEITLGVELRL